MQKCFFICKAELENQGKMEKADWFDGIYCMSRNLLVCNLMIMIELILRNTVYGLRTGSIECWQIIVVSLYFHLFLTGLDSEFPEATG